MTHSKLPSREAGVYLFRAPARVTVQINRQLLVVFSLRNPKACGIVLYPEDASARDLFSLLDTMYRKATEELGVARHELNLKLFGCSHQRSPHLLAAYSWLKLKGLELSGSDTGRSVTRNIVIDSASGHVGVSYAESVPTEVPFLSTGSARQRLTLENRELSVLILTQNAKRRLLCRQAIEEHRTWEAESPADLNQTFKIGKTKTFKHDLVILFDDLEENEKVERWTARIHKIAPGAKLCWVGAELPEFAEKSGAFSRLPLPEEENMADFKTELNRIATENPIRPTTGDVLTFSRRKRKRA